MTKINNSGKCSILPRSERQAVQKQHKILTYSFALFLYALKYIALLILRRSCTPIIFLYLKLSDQ